MLTKSGSQRKLEGAVNFILESKLFYQKLQHSKIPSYISNEQQYSGGPTTRKIFSDSKGPS